MNAFGKNILSLILILLLALTTVLASSCGNNKPIDESQLPDLQSETQQSAGADSNSDEAGADQSQNSEQIDEPLVSEGQAMSIALKKVPGANQSHIVSFGRDYDDGRWIYEGEIRYNGLEYDFEIDAQTGNILEWEIDD